VVRESAKMGRFSAFPDGRKTDANDARRSPQTAGLRNGLAVPAPMWVAYPFVAVSRATWVRRDRIGFELDPTRFGLAGY
jgi:hypothetical protein